MCKYAAGLAALLPLLGACGQRGPLYLPEKTETAIRAPAAPPDSPAAATQSSMPDAADESKRDAKSQNKPAATP